MELRHLRYFVAVAEAGNFTRAAETLGISQPPLSQQIQRLEHELGSPLFRRLTRTVELTPAGQVLYEDAIKILKMSDAAFEKARSVGRGLSGSLRIGFASSTALNPQVFSLLHSFREHYPMINLYPGELHMAALVNELLKGSIDLGFIRLPCARSHELEYRVMDTEQMVVALPANHPLAGKAELASLAELADETLIIFPGKFLRVYMTQSSPPVPGLGLIRRPWLRLHRQLRLSVWWRQDLAIQWCLLRWAKLIRRMCVICRLTEHR